MGETVIIEFGTGQQKELILILAEKIAGVDYEHPRRSVWVRMLYDVCAAKIKDVGE